MKLPIPLFILFVLLTSCRKEPDAVFIVNKEGTSKNLSFSPKELEGTNIGPMEKYGLIDDIHFVDDDLFLYDVKSDSIFITYNLNEGIDKHFSQGEGPDQFISPDALKFSSINDMSNVQVFEFGRGLYQLDFATNKKTPLFRFKNLDLPRGIQSVTMIEEGKFAFVDTNSTTIFSIIDLETKVIKEIPNTVKDDVLNLDQYYEAITPPDIGYNKEHKILFTWTGVFNSIDLYDTNGEFIKSYGYGINQNLEENKYKRKYFYYYNVKSQGDYIYGLYAGFNTVDNFTEAVLPNLESQLHIFNMRTDEASIYHFDRLINACTVDFTNNIIYAIEENNESQPLVRYEID